MSGVLRRRFLIASSVLAAFGARAQAPGRIPRVGMLSNASASTGGHLMQAFARGLSALGYIDGKNVLLEVRYAEGQLDRLPALVQDLADRKVDVLFAPSALASGAAKKAGFAAPIVFAFTPDPLADGFVASLARPGGNMTGLTSQSTELAAKRVELLREAFPKTSRLAALYALPFPGVSLELQETERAARVYGAELLRIEAARPESFDAAFAEMANRRADALVVIENPMFFTNRKEIVRHAEQQGLPAIYKVREYAASGGLMSYGSDYADLARRAAGYVDRILKGAKPGELPVEQPVKFELIVNLTTAKTMGLTIPRGVLLRANDVIQ
ncbi:MAG TPA: ABC transporter substrate-binding protein [Burkholderiales bacterium]|jgi:putative ABC transport system substrate-binding protein|nr:ABC transporter substrate-binding protein [Burkholderiales bacterium]